MDFRDSTKSYCHVHSFHLTDLEFHANFSEVVEHPAVSQHPKLCVFHLDELELVQDLRQGDLDLVQDEALGEARSGSAFESLRSLLRDRSRS